MSVNLNKQSVQKHKVSLRKEEPNNEKDSLKKGDTPKNTEGGKRLLFWTAILAVAILLTVGIWIRKSSTEEKVERKAFSTIDFESAKADMGYKNEDSVAATNNSVENDADKENLNENIAFEENNNMKDLSENTQSQEETEPETEANGEESAVTAIEPNQRLDDASIHNYEVIIADVTWSEAFVDCISRGGYLCRINSVEENEKIKELLNNQDVGWIVYLGGMREEDSNEYHWIDSDNVPYDDVLNNGEYAQFWYDGEPSYAEYVDGEEIIEKYMTMIYRSASKEWVWNDVSDDFLSLLPDYYSGKISYICEYE